jgi:hypothetical protein
MNSGENGQPLMDVVLQFFQEDHWNYQKLENKPVVRVGYRGERGTWVCYARVDEGHQRFVFHSLMGMNIPSEYRAAVSEYLMRVNLELPVGNFEMNMDSGEIRFKVSVETPNGELSVAMVRTMAYTSLHTMDHFFPGVLAVVHGGLSPESALKRVASQAAERG